MNLYTTLESVSFAGLYKIAGCFVSLIALSVSVRRQPGQELIIRMGYFGIVPQV